MDEIPKWSLIICTYNAGKRLTDCILNLTKLELINDSEVLVIDNCSDDGSVELLKEYAFELKFRHFKIFREINKGLSYARIRGVSEAKGKYLLFIDDDNFPENNFLIKATEIFESNNRIGMIGGQSRLPTDTQIKSYFLPFLRGLAVGCPHEKSGILYGSSYLWGACLAIRKVAFVDFLTHLKNFIFLDRKGNSVLSGGDGELVLSTKLLGWDAYYSSDLKFIHMISPSRFNIRYFSRLYKIFGMIAPAFNVLKNAANELIPSPDKGYRKPSNYSKAIQAIKKKKNDFKNVRARHMLMSLCLLFYLNGLIFLYKFIGKRRFRDEILMFKKRVFELTDSSKKI
jgi:glycosyltransferase involved in cell wall biosynthesis